MAKWTDPVSASADFLGNGAIEINKYESEIVDIIRRSSTALQRFSKKPATGHPHRYFDQTAIATGAFSDPRTIAVSATSPTRTERAAMIKAITAQTNVGLFDVDVTRMQGQFAQVEAQDIADITSAVIVTEAAAVWAGTDTSLSTPTTTQYMGLLKQITTQSTIALGASIIDGIKAQVATMVANQTYVIRPTAIYLNPQLADFIDREAKGQKIDMDRMEVVGGVMVNAIMTQAGLLPLIPEPFVPATTDTSYGFTAPTGGTSNYFAVIVTENLIEMPYVHGGDGNPNPRLFQLGLVSNLQGQFVAVHFNTIIAKLAGPHTRWSASIADFSTY
jgi:hypothetical protein